MISGRRRNNKPSQQQSSTKNGSKIITLKEGYERVYKVGIVPFFERVENMDNEGELQKISIDKQQYIEVYDTIFTMCIQREPNNYSSQLYQKHSEALTRQYKEKFFPVLTSVKNEQGVIFLKEWDKRWRCNKWNVDGMSRMFTYLDRFHVPNSEDLLNTKEQGHTLYRETVFEQFKDTARQAILACIQRERDGEEQDRDLLRDSIAVYVELGNKLKKVELEIYKQDFDKYLVQETKQYYKQKARCWLDQQSCPEYLIQAEKCVNDEIGRLNSYIDKYSETGLMAATRDELLKHIQDELLLTKKSGIDSILERTVGAEAQIAREDLSRIHRLFSTVPGGKEKVAEAVKNHVTKLGMGFIENSKQNKDNDAHKLIIQLIDLHDRFLNIVKREFQEEAVSHKALKEAFETFINKEYYTSALLARFANDMLKKGTKVASSDLENTMNHVVMLYGYIRDKDIFERDYQLYLASRLLQNLSESEQAERSMIGKLKNEAGYHWTSKLQDMFKDIQRSKEMMEGFRGHIANTNDFGIDLNVSVCTTGAWPDGSIPAVQMAGELGPIAEAFKSFYLSRFSGRKLRYQMDKGKADVQVQFSAKVKKILAVSTYQMLVLLLFNNKKTFTFKEIMDATGCPKDDLRVAVLSMAHPKIKVLRKAPNTKDIAENHKFQINPAFTNPRAKVIVPTLSLKKQIITEPDSAILTSRRHQMDAAIVRIMKARKTMQHQDLITEVVKQLIARFKPKGSDIKKRIASLIDLEYLERDENERGLYHYKQ